MATSSSNFRNRYWPQIADRETARRVARQAFWGAVLVSGITAVFATLAAFGTSLAGVGTSAFGDAALFGFIALGIWRMSRVAAVSGLVLFVLERIWMWRDNPRAGNIIVAVLFTVAFANGVRATFRYHRLLAAESTSADTGPVGPG